jgi:hypothetical protein
MSLDPVEIRLYDAAGARQPLPDAYVLDWDFESLVSGGYGNFALTLLAEFQDALIPALPVVDGMIEWWFAEEPAFRGWIEKITPAIRDGAPSFALAGAGLMARMKTLATNARYIKPGGADVSEAFAWLASHYLTGAERFGAFAQAIQALSPAVSIDRFDAFSSDALSVAESLAEQAGDLLIWGWDMTGGRLDRLYVKPRPAAVSDADADPFRIGRDVNYYEEPADLAQVINAARITGGPEKAPNLVYNSSWELPVINGDGGAGNLVLSPSFEDALHWTYSGGSSRKQTGSALGEYARTGDYFGEVDNPGEYIQQTVILAAALTVPTKYTLEVPHAAEAATLARSIAITLQCLDAADGDLGTPVDAYIVDVISQAYETIPANFVKTLPVGTKKCRIRIAYNDATGGATLTERATMIDDVALYETDDAAQDGWTSQVRGTAGVEIDWIHENAAGAAGNLPYHGLYSIRAVTTGCDGTDANTTRIYPTEQHWIGVRGNTGYRIAIAVRGTAALSYRCGWERKDSAGVLTRVWGAAGATPSDGDWTRQYVDLTTAQATVAVRPIIELRGNGTYDLDGIDLFEYTIEQRTEFAPGEQIEYSFRSDDAELAAGLSSAAKASIATYGLREAVIDAPELASRARAAAYITGYFNRYAIPLRAAQLVLEPCDVHLKYVADDDVGTPAGLVRIAGAGLSIDDQFPAKIHYLLALSGAIRCEVDLTNVRPDPALLLLRAQQAGGGGVSAMSANLSATAGNTQGGGTIGAVLSVEEWYGPNEPGAFLRTWDANDGIPDPDLGRKNGTVTVTVQQTPAAGEIFDVDRIPGMPLYDGVHYNLAGSVITFVEGEHPILDGTGGGERIRVRYKVTT